MSEVITRVFAVLAFILCGCIVAIFIGICTMVDAVIKLGMKIIRFLKRKKHEST